MALLAVLLMRAAVFPVLPGAYFSVTGHMIQCQKMFESF